jgi:hypothetical protein
MCMWEKNTFRHVTTVALRGCVSGWVGWCLGEWVVVEMVMRTRDGWMNRWVRFTGDSTGELWLGCMSERVSSMGCWEVDELIDG